MKILPFILLLALLSCNEITYKEPQPKGKKILNEIPESLQGKYLAIDANGIDKDTLYLVKDGFYVQGDEAHKGVLGDSLVVKKYKGYYFFNMQLSSEWVMRVIKREKNGDITIMAMDDKNINSLMKKLGGEIRIDSTKDINGTSYEIDPTAKQLMDFLKKKYFGMETRIQKID